MLIDTDVLVWVVRGSPHALAFVHSADSRNVSAISYMELVQGSRDQREARGIRAFLKQFEFKMLPVTESISHRAINYMESHALASGLSVTDALIAATAADRDLVLATANRKHFAPIKDLDLKVFRP
jgi:predicted nucleic acid-binding protein